MPMWHIHFFIIFIFFNYSVFSAQNKCSRTVQINGKNVSIDASSTQKGEGLRYYLSKDPIAYQYFEQYTDSNKPNWRRIGVSTFGIGLITAGLLSSNETKNIFYKRDTLFYSGIGIVALSFLYAKTKQGEKEVWLEKSVKEYNKRSQPKIYWAPQYAPEKQGWGLTISREY